MAGIYDDDDDDDDGFDDSRLDTYKAKQIEMLLSPQTVCMHARTIS